MKKIVLIFLILVFMFNSSLASIIDEREYPYEIELEDYFGEVNSPELKLKSNEKFKRLGAFDIKPKEKKGYREGRFSIGSESEKNVDRYLRGGIEQTHSAKYSGKYFEFSTGIYNSYNEANMNNMTEEFFFKPKIKSKGGLSLELNNAFDSRGEYFEQELGVKYSPKFMKNSSFGVTSGTKFNKNSHKSEKLKFTTDFYLF